MGMMFEEIVNYWKREKESHPEFGDKGVLTVVVGEDLDKWEITVRKCSQEEAFSLDAEEELEFRSGVKRH